MLNCVKSDNNEVVEIYLILMALKYLQSDLFYWKECSYIVQYTDGFEPTPDLLMCLVSCILYVCTLHSCVRRCVSQSGAAPDLPVTMSGLSASSPLISQRTECSLAQSAEIQLPPENGKLEEIRWLRS